MSTAWFYTIASVIVVSLISLIGIAAIAINETRLKRALFLLVSLAAGGMFGDAFIHLLPESFRDPVTATRAPVCVLGGIFTFFILEKFLRWVHRHNVGDNQSVHPVGYINLIADGAHNLIDGMLIGASYLAGLPIGVATTTAVILHEIPQEIGDFGILVQAGFTRRGALLFNFLSASLAILGAVTALIAGDKVEAFTSLMVPFAAGAFIYIAGSDLLPELQKEIKPARSLLQLAAIATGVLLMLLFTLLD